MIYAGLILANVQKMLLHNFVGKHDSEWVHIKAFFENKFLIFLCFLSPEGCKRRSRVFCFFSTFQTMKKKSEITYVTNATVLQRH